LKNREIVKEKKERRKKDGKKLSDREIMKKKKLQLH
jgi:hypothetical protein